jgi:hypothetical protein
LLGLVADRLPSFGAQDSGAVAVVFHSDTRNV